MIIKALLCIALICLAGLLLVWMETPKGYFRGRD